MLKELEDELKIWERKGMNPNGIGVDVVQMRVNIVVLTEMVRELLDMTETEYEVRYQQKLCEMLLATRKQFEQEQLRASQESVLSIARSQLLGPNGQPLN